MRPRRERVRSSGEKVRARSVDCSNGVVCRFGQRAEYSLRPVRQITGPREIRPHRFEKRRALGGRYNSEVIQTAPDRQGVSACVMNGLALPVFQLIEIEPRRGTAETSDFECLRHFVRFVPVLSDG